MCSLARYFESMISSHQFGAPKEHDEFWMKLESHLHFDPARALFVDDSLAVLRTARRRGVAQVFAITHPDSTQALREVTEFPAIEAVVQLLSEELLSSAPALDKNSAGNR